MQVSIREAKTGLSSLIQRVLMGEEVIIARAGKPVVKLVAVEKRRKRTFGSAKGKILLREGWHAPLSDPETRAFLGR